MTAEMTCRRLRIAAAVCASLAAACGNCQAQSDVALPRGVKAVWDLARAHRRATATRERVCINGLWRWQPASSATGSVPEGGWGYFKVPGCWPGITDYMQKDCQSVLAHSSWRGKALGRITAAWYQRKVTVPEQWTGRRITVEAAYVNSHATVHVDGRRAGAVVFPDRPQIRPGGVGGRQLVRCFSSSSLISSWIS